jgi:hypothetical protein
MPNVDPQTVGRFMDLFKGSERGYGFGEGWGARHNEQKNKNEYSKGAIGWKHGKLCEQDFADHLNGKRALGIGPLLDDGTTWRLELDIDKIGPDGGYENIDPKKEVLRLKETGIPFVPSISKSAGLRVILFFTGPMDAEVVREGGRNLCASLGYSGNEIFPKQSKLAEKDDAPSWTFLPYGPTFGIFARQEGVNDYGNPIDTVEGYVEYAFRSRITPEEFMKYAFGESRIKTETRKSEGAKQRKGTWVEGGSYEETVRSMFCDGPPCLWTLAHNRVSTHQNNFLVNCLNMFKRKYSDNWDQAITWVNVNVLRPIGNTEKLAEMIRNFKKKDYEYMCKEEPIVSHCNPYACRIMKYGVGSMGGGGIHHMDLGLTIMNTEPKKFFANVGDSRVMLKPEDLANQKRFQLVCIEYRAHIPHLVPQREWTERVEQLLEDATVVEAPDIMRSHSDELEVLESYFDMHVPGDVRRYGQEFLDGKKGDYVRVKIEERMFYFKWQKVLEFCRRISYRQADIFKLRAFIYDKGHVHSRTELRDWYRSTMSVSWDLFDEARVDQWVSRPLEDKSTQP